MKFIEYIAYISMLSVLVPMVFTFFALCKQRFNLRLLNLLSLLLLASFLIGIIAYIVGVLYHTNNHYILNIYAIIQFILLTLMYAYLSKLYRYIIYIVGILFLGYELINSLFFEPITQYQSSIRIISSACFVIYSLFYFLFVLKQPAHSITKGKFNFYFGYLWFNGGVLFYFSVSLSVFILSYYLLPDPQKKQETVLWWALHNIANITKNMFFAVAAWYMGKARIN